MDENPTFGLPTQADAFEEIAKSDQHISVATETRRYGKVITLVSGLDKTVDLKDVARSLKEGLACGGTVKNGVIELQGNHLKRVKPILARLGFSEESISD